MPEPRPAYVVHVLPGRARIKIPSARGDHAYCAVLGDALAACTATRAVTISPRTGGVLIFHDGALAGIARFAAEAGLFVLPSLEPALPSMRGQFQGALAALDHGIERATGPNVGVDNRTTAQKAATVALIRELLTRYPSAKVVGHRDLGATQCPGFDAARWWAEVSRPAPAAKTAWPEATPLNPESPWAALWRSIIALLGR